MAITVVEKDEVASSNNTQTYVSNSYTPTANRGLLALCLASATATTTTATGAGNGLTWTNEVSQVRGTAGIGHIFSALTGASPSAGAFTVDYLVSDPATGAGITILEFAGIDLTDFTVQTAVNTAGSGGGTPAVTFGAATAATSAIVVLFGEFTVNPTAITPPSGYTNTTDNGWTTPTTGWEVAYHLSPGAVTTVTWGSAAPSAWVAIAIEIKAASTTTTTVDVSTAGAVTFTGQLVAFRQTQNVVAGQITVTGQAVAFKQTQNVTAGAVTFTGGTVTPLVATIAAVTTAGQITLTGQAVAFTQTQAVTAGALTFTGQATGVVVVVGVTAGQVTFTGQTVTLVTTGPTVVTVTTAGALTFTGQALPLVKSVTPTAGAVTFTGQALGLVTSVGVAAGLVTFTGQTVTGVVSGPVVVTVTTAGLVTYAGQAIVLVVVSADLLIETYEGVRAGGPPAGALEILTLAGALAGGAASSLELRTVDGPTAGGAPATLETETADGPGAGGAASGAVLVLSG